MGWAEAYGEKQAGLQNLTSTLMQQHQENEREKQQRGAGIFGGLLKLVGGALTLLI